MAKPKKSARAAKPKKSAARKPSAKKSTKKKAEKPTKKRSAVVSGAPPQKPARASGSRGAGPSARRSRAKARLTRDEVERRLELARAAAGKRKAANAGEQQRMATALEVAQEMVRERFPSLLKIAFPPRSHAESWRAPWIIVGRFVWRSEIGYQHLHAILKVWSQRKLERRIGSQRMARLRVVYKTDRGERAEYTLAETAEWSVALARAIAECDPTDTETRRPNGTVGSLASRYALTGKGASRSGSLIESVFVWLSDSVGGFTP